MLKNILLLKFLAISLLIACITTVTANNPVLTIVSLIITFILASCYLLLIGIDFIAISYIIIYVGAIAILFLFVILMINIEIKEISPNKKQIMNNLPLGISIFTLSAYAFFSLMPFFFDINNLFLLKSSISFKLNLFNSYLVSLYNNINYANANSINIFANNNEITNFDSLANTSFSNMELIPMIQIETLAINLYTYHSVLIIILGFILLLAMLASIELSIDKKTKN